MRGQSARAACLVALLALGVLVPAPAQAHPFHLQVANEVLDTPDQVRADRWIAQSFVPAANFFVSRVSLFVSDEQLSDVLSVSVRLTASGFPAVANVTAGAADGPSGGTWLNIDLSPVVELSAGQTYWIVAHSDRGGSTGYAWWDSGDDAAYPNGTGASSSDGVAWSSAGKDYAFRVYGFTQPSFTFSVGVSDATLRPAQSAVFRVNFTNAGPGDAAVVWVDASLPPELAYVSDDAASIGGVRSGTYTYTFTNVAPGVYVFNLTAAARGGVPNGTVAVPRFTLDPTDHNGQPLPPTIQDVPVTFTNARLSLALTSSASLVDPGDRIALNATVTNLGSESALGLVLEASVDPNATYVSSAPPGTYDVLTRIVRWTVPVLVPDVGLGLEWVIGVPPGTPDLARVTSTLRVNHEDTTGTSLPFEEASTQARVRSPSFAAGLVLDRSTAERGDEVTATLYYNNTGSVPAPWAWANWTLSDRFSLSGLAPSLPFTTTVDGFSLSLTDVSPGPHSLVARLLVIKGLVDGLPMSLPVSWAAMDGNGNRLVGISFAPTVELIAPSVTLSLTPLSVPVETGKVFTLSLTVRNEGRAPASGWVNLTMPVRTSYVSDNGTFASVVDKRVVTWTLATLPAGSVVVLGVTLVRDWPPAVESFRFSLDFTDEKGSPPATVLSNAIPVEFVAPVPTPTPWPWWWFAVAAVGLAAGLGAAYAWWRRTSEVSVDDVFVVDHNGILLAHRSSGLIKYGDEDVVVGMFTLVQKFIEDAFSMGKREPVRALEFGERKILIEPGRLHYVAVVYRGEDHGELEAVVREVSQEIDRSFGRILETWDGDMDSVRGIGHLLPRIWKRPRPARSPAA